jgi:hypothetical protein
MSDLLILAGLVAVLVGAYLVLPALGLMVLGVLLILAGVALSRRPRQVD